MKVLIVDDDPNIRTLVPMALQGEEVIDAPTVRDAIQAILDDTPDIAIIDVHLPDGDGVDLVRQLRAAACAFPILVFTSGLCESERGAVLSAGADEYLCKSQELLDLRALHARVRRAAAIPEDARRTRRQYFAARALAGEIGELEPPDVDFFMGPRPVEPKASHRWWRRSEPWF